MRNLKTPICPECGEPAIGTVEILRGVALFDADPTEGSVGYEGTTEIDWNGQETATEGSQVYITCDNGHDWLTEIEEDAE